MQGLIEKLRNLAIRRPYLTYGSTSARQRLSARDFHDGTRYKRTSPVNGELSADRHRQEESKIRPSFTWAETFPEKM